MSDNFCVGAYFPSGKRNQYPLNVRLAGAQDLHGRYGKEIELSPLSGNEPRLLGWLTHFNRVLTVG
jgi:hypothetical protein